MRGAKKHNLIQWIIILFIGSVSATHFFPSKFQLSEVLFLVIAVVFALSKPKLHFGKFEKTILLINSVFLLNLIFHHGRNSLVECSILIYLSAMSIIIKNIIQNYRIHDALEKGIILLSTTTILAGVFGWLYYKFSGSFSYILIYQDYPYLGTIIRLKGFTATPSLYASIMNFCILGLVLLVKRSTFRDFLIVTAAICSLLTFSKVFLLLLFVLLIAYLVRSEKTNGVKGISLIAIPFTVLFIALSFFYAKPKNASEINQMVINPEPVCSIGDMDVLTTSYFEMLKASAKIYSDNLATGCGLQNFQDNLIELKQENLYPIKMSTYESHDMYWSKIAELGFPYILLIVGLIFIARRFLISLSSAGVKTRAFAMTSILYMAIESMVANSLSFRHYWIWVALIYVYSFPYGRE